MSLDKTINKLGFVISKMRRLNFALFLMSLQILMFYDAGTFSNFFCCILKIAA